MSVLSQQLPKQEKSSALRRIGYVCYWLFKLCTIFTITSLTMVALFYWAGQQYSHLPFKPIYAFYGASPLYTQHLKAASKILQGKNRSKILNLYLGENADDGWDSLVDFSEYLAYTMQSKKGVKIITKTIRGESKESNHEDGKKGKLKEGRVTEVYKLGEFSGIYPVRRGIRRFIDKIFNKLNITTSPKRHKFKCPRNATLLLRMGHMFSNLPNLKEIFMASILQRLWVFTIPGQETHFSLKQFIKELKLLDRANPSNYILLVSRKKIEFSNPTGKSVVSMQFYIDQFNLRDLSQELLDFVRLKLNLANEAQAQLLLCQTNYSIRAINAFLFYCKLKQPELDCGFELDSLHLSRVENEPTQMMLRELCNNGTAQVILGYDESLLFEFGAVLREKVEWRNENSRMMFQIANGQSCAGTVCNLTWYLSKNDHFFQDQQIVNISKEYYPSNMNSNIAEQINLTPSPISEQPQMQQIRNQSNSESNQQMVAETITVEQNQNRGIGVIEAEIPVETQTTNPNIEELEETKNELPPDVQIPPVTEEML